MVVATVVGRCVGTVDTVVAVVLTTVFVAVVVVDTVVTVVLTTFVVEVVTTVFVGTAWVCVVSEGIVDCVVATVTVVSH